VWPLPTLTVEELETADDERAGLVAAALAVRKRHLTPSERADIEAIESRRERLIAQRRPVEMRHYTRSDDPDESGELRWSARAEPLGEIAARVSASRRKAMALYGLVRELAPRRALEMGTGVGISGAYQGMALRHAGGGDMVALDGAPELAAVAAETFAELGLEGVEVRVGPFAETLPAALAEGPLQYAFVDGHHQEEATLAYFELLLPHAPGAALVFDDIRWSDGMLRAWRRIADDQRVGLAVDLDRYGIAFTR
jgi:predicted O-methyltransferase YrrM